MRFILLKTAVYQKTTITYYISLIEIVVLIIITQLYIPQTNLINLTGGSAGLFENNPQLLNNRVTDDSLSENMDLKIEIPAFETTLWTMGTLNRTNHILYPENATSYILPENEVIKWYADNTVLTDDALLWKHNRTIFKFNYESDNDQFNNPPDGDMWLNPDYYLAHDARGDCEDFSLAFASILEAKGISASVIGLTLINDKNHWIVQYQYNNMTNYADINQKNVIIWHDKNPTILKKWVSIDQKNILKCT